MVISSTARSQEGSPFSALEVNAPGAGACFVTVHKVAVLSFLLGAAVIAGWAFNITLLKSGLPGLTATQPMTALCLLLSALALELCTREGSFARAATYVAAGVVLTITVSILIQNALDTDWGTDRLLFAQAVTGEQTGPYLRAGRPAGTSLIGFGLLGVALLLTAARGRFAQRVYVVFTTLGMVGAISSLVAYGFGLESLYVMGLYVQVGLNTAIGLGLLFAGALVRRADLGLMKYLCGNSLAAVSTRRLLSWTGAVMIVFAGIVQFGTRASWYRAELEIAWMTLAGIGVLVAGLLSHARRIDALEKTGRSFAQRELTTARALAHSQDRKAQFLEKLAHELRNPLSPLRNGLQILRKQTAGDERLKPTVDMMERQLKSLTRALDTLLEEYGRDPRK